MKLVFQLTVLRGPYNSGKSYDNGNMGHRPGVKGGYFPIPPVDSAQYEANILKV